MALPRAILFDLDDTLIRAYAQPEEAWGRLLSTFAEPLGTSDPQTLDRVRVAIMEEAKARDASPPSAPLRAWATTRRWPGASPTPSPRCGGRSIAFIPTPTRPSMRCATPA